MTVKTAANRIKAIKAIKANQGSNQKGGGKDVQASFG